MPGISMELTWWLEGERPGLGARQGTGLGARQGTRADLCRARIAAWGGTWPPSAEP